MFGILPIKNMALKILIFKFPRFVFQSVCSKGISDAFRDLHPNVGIPVVKGKILDT